MMSIIFNLILIAVFCTFAIDITGAVQEIYNSFLKMIFGFKKDFNCPKPFGCSVCSSFWLGLIYLVIINNFSIALVTLNIVIATIVPQLTILLYNLFQKLINNIL